MKKLTAYPAFRTFLLVPPMFVLLSVFATRGPRGDPEWQRDMAAAHFLKTLAASQLMFETTCGHGGYAVTIEQLVTPPPGSSSGFFDKASMEDAALRRSITLIPTEGTSPLDCRGRPTARSFLATSVPKEIDSGRRSFTVTRGGTIWYSESAVPPSPPFEKTGKKLN